MIYLHIIFYIFAAIAISAGFMVVVSNNPVRSVLFLVTTFLATAAIWLILQAEFLALILVLVYVGAVMTLFLFVVMMLNIKLVKLREHFVRYFPLALLIVGLTVAIMLMVVNPHRFGLQAMPAPPMQPRDYSNIANLGAVLYTHFAYPFEIAAVILLTAIIAAISLTYRLPKKMKTQNISKQIAVRARDRVRLVKMPSDKRVDARGKTE